MIKIFSVSMVAMLLIANPVSALEHCSCSEDDQSQSSIASSLDSDTNNMCPVMTGQTVEDQWSTIYKGKLVKFCCNNCVEDFRREPEKYVAALPQFNNQNNVDETIEKAEGPVNYLTWTSRAVLLMLGLAFCFYPAQSAGSMLARVTVVAFLATGFFALHLFRSNQQLKLELVKQYTSSEIHRSTYYDYGVPPTPNNPRVQPVLSRTFYRGNDERSPLLYNGGNYETAQFDIEIQFADGMPVKVGDQLNDRTLFLNYTIRKPEHAPKRMYDESIMGKIFLTRSYEPMMGWDEPITDKTPIKETSDGTWNCRFPLHISSTSGKRFNPDTVTRQELAAIEGIDADEAHWFVTYRDAGYPVNGPDDLRQAGITGQPAQIISSSLKQSNHEGLVYVCEAFFHKDYKNRQLGSRFHYGIKYDLKIQGDRILDGSEIWMGALSRSLKAKKGAIPDNQWLGPDPLPQLPSPQQNLNDKLLGADDYTF